MDEYILAQTFRQIWETRSHATLLACIVDDSDIQRYIPQFLLTKDSALNRLEKEKLRNLPRPTWISGTDGWVTAHHLKGLLTTLRRVIRIHRPAKQIVLVMDCASQHANVTVLNHCARLQLHVILIPSGMTWHLQPWIRMSLLA